ncbi:MAG: hypothetical protein ACI9YE_001670 [Psychroserpens sp.]|jgi:hypothetical protein
MESQDDFFRSASSKLPDSLKKEVYGLYKSNVGGGNKILNEEVSSDFKRVLNDGKFISIILSLLNEAKSSNYYGISEYSHLVEFFKIAIQRTPLKTLSIKEMKLLKDKQVSAAKRLLSVLNEGLYDPSFSDLISLATTDTKIEKSRFLEITEFQNSQRKMLEEYKFLCEKNKCEEGYLSVINPYSKPRFSELLSGFISALSEERKDEDVNNNAQSMSLNRIRRNYDCDFNYFGSYKNHLVFERRLFSHCIAVFNRIPKCIECFHDWMFNNYKIVYNRDGETRAWNDAVSDFYRYKK